MASEAVAEVIRPELDGLVESLYGLASIRRGLQRLAGVENAVAAMTALSILENEGPTRISDIADGLQVDLSVASRHLHVLEEKGFVRRIPDPTDRRSSLAVISARGREKLKAAQRRLVEGLAVALADWNPAEVSALAEGLLRLRGALGRSVPEIDYPIPPAPEGAEGRSSR